MYEMCLWKIGAECRKHNVFCYVFSLIVFDGKILNWNKRNSCWFWICVVHGSMSVLLEKPLIWGLFQNRHVFGLFWILLFCFSVFLWWWKKSIQNKPKTCVFWIKNARIPRKKMIFQFLILFETLQFCGCFELIF